MKILPVLDVLHGRAVAAVGGRRERYLPLRSAFSAQSDPVEIAAGLRTQFKFVEIYVADLDAIVHRLPNHELTPRLADLGLSVFIDPGARDSDDVRAAVQSGAAAVVVGSETWRAPHELADLVREFGADRLVLSIDMIAGRVRSPNAKWCDAAPRTVIAEAWALGVRRFFPLELCTVGTAAGLPTLDFVRETTRAFPGQYWVGGGASSADDLQRAAFAGANAVLVATALYRGGIDSAEVRRWNESHSEV